MQLPNAWLNESLDGHAGAMEAAALASSRLPFVVRVVRTERQLLQVCELRALAYGKHVPEFGPALLEPELSDREPGTVVLMADDKQTGQTIGTVRIHTNVHRPLPVQRVVKLPEAFDGPLLVEACRLSVRPGYNKVEVRLALFKALYLYCLASQVQHMVVAAKRPLNMVYRSLGFRPVEGDEEQWVPLPYAHHINHSILAFSVLGAERQWHQINHPLYQFMVCTYHPDIQVFAAVSSAWSSPRQAEVAASL